MRPGKDDGAWARFVELYEPALRHFAVLVAPGLPSADIDEIVQDTFVRLVDVLREGGYDPARARFRTYLATIVRRLAIDRFRRNATQQKLRDDAGEAAGRDGGSPSDPAAVFDLRWRLAYRKAAEERVLSQSALAVSSKELWRLVSGEGMSVKEAAKSLGIPANTASKTKRRIEAMIAAVEAEFIDR